MRGIMLRLLFGGDYVQLNVQTAMGRYTGGHTKPEVCLSSMLTFLIEAIPALQAILKWDRKSRFALSNEVANFLPCVRPFLPSSPVLSLVVGLIRGP